MNPVYQYFMIPFANAPSGPTYTVWFASWSQAQPDASWSKARPAANLDTSSTWVIGLTAGDIPAGATLLGSSTKDPPPPPLALTAKTAPSLAAYQKSFVQWLDSRSA
jgi:hypothetical protein